MSYMRFAYILRAPPSVLILAFILCPLALILPWSAYAEHSETCKLHSPYKELIGSPESLARQNEAADRAGLLRVRDNAELRRLVKQKYFVFVPRKTSAYYYAGQPQFRYALPFALEFLERLADEYHKETGGRLKVSSFFRTEKYQSWLEWLGVSDIKREEDSRRSVHTTGAAFDISKREMTEEQVEWMRKRLLELERPAFAEATAGKQGLIEATEEMCSNAFHIMVFS